MKYLEKEITEDYIQARLTQVKGLIITCLRESNNENLIEPFNECFLTKGKNKGFMRSKGKGSIQKAIIQGLWANANAFKLTPYGIMFLTPNELEIFDIFKLIGDKINLIARQKNPKADLMGILDSDHVALSTMGAW